LLHQETINEESQTALDKENSKNIIQYFESISYSCGLPILLEDHSLFDQLHIHLTEDGIIDPSDGLKLQFKTIYPLCASCHANGHEWSTHAPV
ncbi:3707_t:CDS:2, partial [Cetraspora pellucida]